MQLKIYEYSFNKDKGRDQALLPHFYYLINPGIVFPLDYSSQRTAIQPLARLRPELVAAYRDFRLDSDSQLLSQAFMTSSLPDEFKRHEDEKVMEACRWMEKGKISELASRLNKLDLLIVDSFSLKTMMK